MKIIESSVPKRPKPVFQNTVFSPQDSEFNQCNSELFISLLHVRYPIAGRIIFRQPSEDWTEDTIILMDMLVHADGTSLNDTKDHRWGVSINPPGKDFYNWTARCVSAGASFDPFQVSVIRNSK